VVKVSGYHKGIGLDLVSNFYNFYVLLTFYVFLKSVPLFSKINALFIFKDTKKIPSHKTKQSRGDLFAGDLFVTNVSHLGGE